MSRRCSSSRRAHSDAASGSRSGTPLTDGTTRRRAAFSSGVTRCSRTRISGSWAIPTSAMRSPAYRPCLLRLAARHKGDPHARLAPLLKDRCRLVIAYGESGELTERDLGGKVPLERGTTFEDVVLRARRAARPGDAVLLSPACS